MTEVLIEDIEEATLTKLRNHSKKLLEVSRQLPQKSARIIKDFVASTTENLKGKDFRGMMNNIRAQAADVLHKLDGVKINKKTRYLILGIFSLVTSGTIIHYLTQRHSEKKEIIPIQILAPNKSTPKGIIPIKFIDDHSTKHKTLKNKQIHKK